MERPFQYIEGNLLNGRTFRTLEHLNEVARCWLSEIADRGQHGTTRKTPLELHAEELSHLLPMPNLEFDTSQVVYRHVETMVREATENSHSSWEFLERLLERPALEHRQRSVERRIHEARFPTTASLESFDWSFNAKTIPLASFQELATGEFLARRDNLVFVGS